MTALIFGGSASGKSRYGEELIGSMPRRGPLIYLAAMEPYGPEAEARIARHRRQRAGKGFQTVERSRDLAGLALPEGSAVLLEDLGNLAANELFGEGAMDVETAYARLAAGLDKIMDRAEHFVMIGNDLFRDGEDYPPETEAYLALLAKLQCRLAEQVDRAVELVCGIPIVWKGEAT